MSENDPDDSLYALLYDVDQAEEHNPENAKIYQFIRRLIKLELEKED